MPARGTLRFGIAVAALFMGLSVVVWRQSRALEVLRELDAARSERAILESERAMLQRRVQELEGRARIVAVAGERLDLRPPLADEIVILRLPSELPSAVVEARLALSGDRP